MPRLQDNSLVIGMAEAEHHYWGGGKPLIETLIELSAPAAVMSRYVIEDANLGTEACPYCHKPLAKAHVFYCKSCGRFGTV